jgi:sortase (surface protein transpeptidase)
MKKQTIILSIVIVLLLGSFYLAGQILKQNSIEKQQQLNILQELQKEELRKEAEIERQKNIDSCFSSAYYVYIMDWDNACETIGREKNCSLTSHRAEKLNEQLEKARNNCLKRY